MYVPVYKSTPLYTGIYALYAEIPTAISFVLTPH